ncbi:hypothetical protein S7711_09154 [Stachybotrys chartarum IBT 7711]|uniref:glycogenin glucosyltransferase n=1 Tax=Stachybotrys chartarum (strain CBS 109288 / IBT 7711) TaxID=1280523 RepID=A0A084AHP3_STACB|nr:hypothetical protein S7711_09154 [Stachybotrys chartarum IBT 7711]
MSATGGEQVYATLLLSDSYLPGALVLAHSLRDACTTKKLAVLVTIDSVSAESITQLRVRPPPPPLRPLKDWASQVSTADDDSQTIYDYVLAVPRIRNDQPANLYLMNRADLHSAFTKINLWRQTQFSKIVYIDADVLAYRAPDELFDIAHAFSAAPDIGWPDIFNTGVMVLTPNMGDYYAMMAMAERGISFDGADQGLLNMHFKNSVNRLSFTYNVTPSAHYQYVPAYRHFQSSINMVHFIGSNKPWFTGRDASFGASPYDEMVGRWWAVYDRHYRVQETSTQQAKSATEFVQYFTKGEWQPQSTYTPTTTGEHHHSGQSQDLGREAVTGQPVDYHVPPQPGHDQPGHHRHHEPPHDHGAHAGEPAPHVSHPVPFSTPIDNSSGIQAEARVEQQVSHRNSGGAPPPPEHKPEPAPIPMHSWDAQRQPPPLDSKPEALNFPSTHYTMSQDSAPFVPPERYPSPPKNMWYEVPKEPPAPTTRVAPAIFPWEGHQPRPSRWFPKDQPQAHTSDGPRSEAPGERAAVTESDAPTESSVVETSEADPKSVPSTPATPTIKVIPSDPWTSFPRNNAWDAVPEITRYIDGLQKHRRSKSQGVLGGARRGPGKIDLDMEDRGSSNVRGFVLTDFPSEVERPSLPVTPAPIHRPILWGQDESEGHEEGDESTTFPVAQGVPGQSEWDPAAQLKKLAQQQSEALLRRLSGDDKESIGANRDIPSRPLPFGSEPVIQPSYPTQSTQGVVSPKPVRVGSASIPEPSYTGPGAAWEKGETPPLRQTPKPHTNG